MAKFFARLKNGGAMALKPSVWFSSGKLPARRRPSPNITVQPLMPGIWLTNRTMALASSSSSVMKRTCNSESLPFTGTGTFWVAGAGATSASPAGSSIFTNSTIGSGASSTGAFAFGFGRGRFGLFLDGRRGALSSRSSWMSRACSVGASSMTTGAAISADDSSLGAGSAFASGAGAASATGAAPGGISPTPRRWASSSAFWLKGVGKRWVICSSV